MPFPREPRPTEKSPSEKVAFELYGIDQKRNLQAIKLLALIKLGKLIPAREAGLVVLGDLEKLVQYLARTYDSRVALEAEARKLIQEHIAAGGGIEDSLVKQQEYMAVMTLIGDLCEKHGLFGAGERVIEHAENADAPMQGFKNVQEGLRSSQNIPAMAVIIASARGMEGDVGILSANQIISEAGTSRIDIVPDIQNLRTRFVSFAALEAFLQEFLQRSYPLSREFNINSAKPLLRAKFEGVVRNVLDAMRPLYGQESPGGAPGKVGPKEESRKAENPNAPECVLAFLDFIRQKPNGVLDIIADDYRRIQSLFNDMLADARSNERLGISEETEIDTARFFLQHNPGTNQFAAHAYGQLDSILSYLAENADVFSVDRPEILEHRRNLAKAFGWS